MPSHIPVGEQLGAALRTRVLYIPFMYGMYQRSNREFSRHMKVDPNTRRLAALLVLVLCPAAPALAVDSLTVVSWGGDYTRSQVEAHHKPFTARTGIRIRSENHEGGLAGIRAQVRSGEVTWDVVDLVLSDIVRGCEEGLLEPLDLDLLPPAPNGRAARDDFVAGTLHNCGVGSVIWSTIFAYDDTRFPGAKPARIADFFDTVRFPGKRGLRRTPRGNLEFALMADGVPPGKVYEVLATEEGIDRAFAKLDTIEDDIVWWIAGAQPPQLLADGEVVMTTAYNGRIFNAQVQNREPFVIVWDGQIWDIDLWAIPKGARNRDAAMAFISFATDTQRLADQAAWISYGPVRQSSIPLIGSHAEAGIPMRALIPTAPENFRTAVQSDFEFWADYQEELKKRFDAWVSE